jgi:RNA polymerase sigma factor (sigma-70 family)
MFDTPTPILRHIRRLAKAEPSRSLSDAECLARFATAGDEAAFETLVRRHGPMVFRVCHSVLGEPNAAEDAVQATFLVLARRVASVRKHQSLGSWLFKVARRIALRDKASGSVRRRREASAACRSAANPLDEVSWREVQAIFFGELDKLSERYRAPLLLCWAEGRTHDEAAAHLGLAPATLKKQLERGRKLLRQRLARRGLALSAGVIACRASAGAPVSAGLLEASVRAGAAGRAAGVTAKLVSPRVEKLAGTVARTTLFGRFALAAGVALIAGALAAGIGRWPEPEAAKPAGDADRPVSRPAADRTDARGDPLPAGAVSRLGSLRLRHGGNVEYVSFLPDGKKLLSKGKDGVRVWDVASGAQLGEFPTAVIDLSDRVASSSPDGKLFAAAGESGIGLWDIASGRHTRTLGKGGYCAARWSPDGKLIAAFTAQFPRLVEVLEVDTGRQLWSKDPGKLPVSVLTFSPDGKTLIAGGWTTFQVPARTDHVIFLLDARTGEEPRCSTQIGRGA